jgi:hypothetical protein
MIKSLGWTTDVLDCGTTFDARDLRYDNCGGGPGSNIAGATTSWLF